MAYPYMNGVLHAGHSFTLSKVEFATGFERMLGKNALFPLGFHCTGLPIKACADKLVREIEQFGKNFDQNLPVEEEQQDGVEDEKTVQNKLPAKKEDITKFTAKKSKAAVKQSRAKYQYEIMLALGIPREDVHKFADANYWVDFFPPLCQRDCQNFGARIDWRRSMVTTDINPYYDAFVRWQMNRLYQSGKIKFGKRYTIFSAKDNQPCMDHDRQVGEAVNPQEYTAIKIKVLEFCKAAQESLKAASFDFANKSVYLVAATLRPETMYGQTCCFVSPKINYGIFHAVDNEYYICTERAFKNMCFQDLTPTRGVYDAEATISGADLIGSKINAPLSVYPELRVLPMDTILPSKGTGVVTSVPSDSPDDYITCLDLQNKPDYYKIQKEWASFDPVRIIKTPSYGELTAKTLVEQLKIKSPKDKDALAAAKELAYKEGFYQGTMIIGKYKGESVEVAKPKVRDDLIAAKLAFIYSEPEGLVISRSGDECVVSLQDQWYTDYGEESWRKLAEECLQNMKTYTPETRNAFEKVLGWLKNWALSRTYGLGSHIPWDPQYLVESLSDSTVYMAYYTVSHLLHFDFHGKDVGPLGISADQMTDAVWDYIFGNTESVEGGTDILEEKLVKLKSEFEYFYPLDVRVSGKDLIPNHLTFCIYVHTALFPKKHWPQGVRVNGHLLLNNEKMSKSTGNFMTLEEIIKKFGADCARIALADAGDTFEDANFDESNANAAILRLYNLKEWMEEVVKNQDKLRTGVKDSFFDKAFENEMNELILSTSQSYADTYYKAALKSGLFDFQSARDYYRESTADIGMHKDLLMRYIECQALMITPIAPHFAEYVWRDILGHKSSVQHTLFPQVSHPIDNSISASLSYVRGIQRRVRETEGANMKKKKGLEFDPKKPSNLSFYVALSFPEWQQQYIDLVQKLYESGSMEFTPELKQQVGKLGDVKRGMQFVNHLKMRLTAQGESADAVFNRNLIFDEVETLKAVLPILRKSPQVSVIDKVEIVVLDDADKTKGVNAISGERVEVPNTKLIQDAVPGSPGITLLNVA